MSIRVIVDERAIALAEQGTKVLKAVEFERIASADSIIRDAVKKSNEIDEQARKAYEAEKQRGYQEGLDEGRSEIASRLTELTAEYSESVSDLQDSLIGILPSLVRKIIGSFNDAELVVKLASSTVKNLSAEKRLRIIVSPSLVESVEAKKNEILTEHPMIEFVEVVANAELDERICEVESETLSVRLDLDEQLDKIGAVIQQSLG